MADRHEEPIEPHPYREVLGEVPGGDAFAGQLSKSVIRGFVGKVRTRRQTKAPKDHELAVIIPNGQGGSGDSVFLDELTLSRDPNNHGFLATFKKELDEHGPRDVTIALTVTAGIVAVGSLYWRHKK